MALTQMQIIQSLGEAMSWLERELQWGVPATEQRHLTGRLGELYAALITNGQMATEVNQKGYDVVSGDGERISVKTTAQPDSAGHISFNINTLDKVDRIIILKVNTEDMQIETLLNAPLEEARGLMAPTKNGKTNIALSKLLKPSRDLSELSTVSSAIYTPYVIHELENGSIEVLDTDGALVAPSKPILREIASKLGLSVLNGNGNPYNTRQLGSMVIRSIQEG